MIVTDPMVLSTLMKLQRQGAKNNKRDMTVNIWWFTKYNGSLYRESMITEPQEEVV
jgi:hypothetical protein